MKIAVISDIHGNMNALEAVMSAINARKPDLIICLGDIVDPLPRSREVLRFLTNENIPILRGNHEDYVIAALTDPKSPMSRLPRWAPVRKVASQFDAEGLKQLGQMPFTLPLTDMRAGEILFVHASPGSNKAGWKSGVSEELAAELRHESARTIVGGHWHRQLRHEFEDKILITIGSVGLPLLGTHLAQYAWLEPIVGGWDVEHVSVAYDHEKTLREFREDGYARECGPMGWMFYEELRTDVRTLRRFFAWLEARPVPTPIDDAGDLVRAAKGFLTEIGVWNHLERDLGDLESWQDTTLKS